jgi:protein TonB
MSFRPRRGGTLAVSLVLHAIALAVVVISQLDANLAGLTVAGRLGPFVVAAAPPPPPDVAVPPPSSDTPVAVDASAAPIAAPDVVLAEPPPAPATSRGVPGGLRVTSDATSFVGPTAGPGVQLAPRRLPPSEPVRPGGDIKAPERLIAPPPVYPDLARAARLEGTVILEATIDETGAVTNVKVLRSIPLLDRAATDAVRRWRYTPTRLNGVPVPVLMTVTVTFTLR